MPEATEQHVIIVGSGGGALCAALQAAASGLRVTVLEKTEKLGGSTALSGGGVWAPNNPLMVAEGHRDPESEILGYFAKVVGDVGPASSDARRRAFISNAPAMIAFLQQEGIRFRYARGFPDYHANVPGGSRIGRTLVPEIFDMRRLGDWKGRMRQPAIPRPLVHVNEVPAASRYRSSISGFVAASKVAVRTARRALGAELITMGPALYGQLLSAALARDVTLLTEAPVGGFLTEDGRIVGVCLKDGREMRATAAVLVASGGFAHNLAMRERYLPAPATNRWTFASPGDTGEMLAAMMDLGAQTDLLDSAWWMPAARRPDGRLISVPHSLAKPHCILVDREGQRFVNEAESYLAIGKAMYARSSVASAVPSWAIMDSQFFRKYRLGAEQLGRRQLDEWCREGALKRADTLASLAAQCGIDAPGLISSVKRFNRFASRHLDSDFGKGENPYNNFFGDPRRPNPNLGPIDVGPYFALEVVPGDTGTNGGVLTNEFAQVLDRKGKVIPGLYASGNVSASVMGRIYPGGGSSLGPALTFSYIAARHIAGAHRQAVERPALADRPERP